MKKLFITLIFGLFILSNAAHAQKSETDSLLPILGNYANKTVSLGGGGTFSPDTGASNIGTATVSVSGNFKGSVTVSPSSGAVRVLNAYPVGTYTVTVRASDFAGFTVVRSFALTVITTSSCNTLDFAGIRANVGNNPNGLAAADFNGDGRQDAATANFSSNNISVLLGNGSGSFGTVTNFVLPSGTNSASAIAVGDFNNDNIADLAVGSSLSGISRVTVFTGTGTGNFSSPINYSLGTNTSTANLAVGDFNGDGRQDIAVRNSSGGLSILSRNTANNGFDAVTNINLAFGINSLAVADFNADGRHDLVVGRASANQVTALIRNTSNNGFDQVNLNINGSSNEVVVGDFTGDGRQDIAASHSGGLDVLPRNALGFDAPVTAGFLFGFSLQVGDFNNDGRLDIASILNSQAAILFRNTGNTNFNPPVTVGGTGFQMTTLAAADFNNDGRADLGALNLVSGQPGSVSVLRRNGTNTNFDLSPVQTLGSTNFADAALGDFDNDGRQDLATATSGTSSVAIRKGSGNGGFTNLSNAVLNSNQTLNGSIIAADFNGDGNTDLIVGNNSINGFSLLPGAGNGSFAPAIDFPVGFQPQRFAVGDFNGDGRQDLAINQTSNQTSIFLRNAGNSGFETAITISYSASPISLTVGDFNNDGNDDFAVSLLNVSSFAVVLRNAANNGFDAPVNYTVNNQNGQLTAADFDGDGNLDLAYGANNVSVYNGSATGVFGSPTILPAGFITAEFLESGDFNGDGRADIVAAISSFSFSGLRSNVAVFLRNATNNGFNPPVGFNGSYILSESRTQRIIVGEVNGDGRQDLITSNGTNGSLQSNFSVMPRVCTVDLNLLGALPNGTAGQNYSKTIYASGGIAPYDFTVSGLPSGLNYSTTADSVTIFGNPSQGGQFNVSVGISDSNPFSRNDFAPNDANELTQILPLQVNFAPTSSNVSISGRVFTADGRALNDATVTLTDQNGTTRTFRSSTFGVFRFDEVEAGQTVIISVKSKRYQFATEVISVSEDVTDLNLTAIE